MSDIPRLCRHGIVTLLLAAAPLVVPARATAQADRDLGDRVIRVFKEAEALQRAGKHAEAIARLKAMRAEVRAEVGPDDPQSASAALALGTAFAEAGSLDEAEAVLREAMGIVRKRPDLPISFRLNIMNNLVEVLVQSGKSKDAIDLSREVVATAERNLGRGDDRTELIRGTLAKLYLKTKQFDQAIAVGRVVVAAAEARHGAEHPETIGDRHTLAVALMETGHYPEAEKLFQQSLKIATTKLPTGHEAIAASKNGLASLYQLQGRMDEARKYTPTARDELKARPGARPSELATLANNQALKAQMGNDFRQAETLYLQAIEQSKRAGADLPQTASILANLSGLYSLWDRYADAGRAAGQSLEITRKYSGRGTLEVAKGEQALALIHLKTGRYEEAEPLLRSSYETVRKRLGPGHPDTVYALANLGSCLRLLHRHREAVTLGTDALNDIAKALPGDNRYTATILLSLGQAYLELGDLGRAAPLLRRSVAIFQKEPGLPTTEAAAAKNALGQLLQLNGQSGQAEDLIRKVIATTMANLGPDHPETTVAIDNLATLLAASGRWRQAADEFDRSRRARRRFLDRTLPAMPRDDQLKLIDMSERISRDGALSLALAHRAEPGMAARSAEWVLNSKAVTLRALARQAILARDATDPAVARLLRDLTAVQGQLAASASATGRSASGSGPGARARYGDLVKREQDLARRLDLALQAPDAGDPWVTIESVRATIPGDARLVELARIQIADYTARIPTLGAEPARYVAWVIPPAGRAAPTIVDLGPADAIEQALLTSLGEIRRGTLGAIARAEPEAERRALDALAILADRLLKPLRPDLDETPRWILSPDAGLWLVPWAALPVGPRRFAVEDHLIRLVVSGRDLLTTPATDPARVHPTAILADPDFDLAPGAAKARARALGRDRPPAGARAAAPSAPRSGLFPAVFDPLPGTRAEAEAIRPLLASYLGEAPEVFLGDAASETVFKALRRPKVVVLSTHGIALPGTRPAPGAGPRPARSAGDGPENPLLRCGIVLAGYNHPPTAAAGEDDGLLTGLEVVGSDLRGTDLVVLSACETGLGDLSVGEGVAGLRQVFQLAGARAVVAALWQVPDVETTELMTAFFGELAGGHPSDEALRRAQLALIAGRRARSGAAHPRFWAAFNLTGSPAPGSRGRSARLSPLTGRPDFDAPWTDAVLALTLSAGGFAGASWWWRRAGTGR